MSYLLIEISGALILIKILVSVLARLIMKVQLSVVQLITFYGLLKMVHPQIIGYILCFSALGNVRGVIKFLILKSSPH